MITLFMDTVNQVKSRNLYSKKGKKQMMGLLALEKLLTGIVSVV